MSIFHVAWIPDVVKYLLYFFMSSNHIKTVSSSQSDLLPSSQVAKDVSIRLHSQLDSIERKRSRLEQENEELRVRLQDLEVAKQVLQQELDKVSSQCHMIAAETAQSWKVWLDVKIRSLWVSWKAALPVEQLSFQRRRRGRGGCCLLGPGSKLQLNPV